MKQVLTILLLIFISAAVKSQYTVPRGYPVKNGSYYNFSATANGGFVLLDSLAMWRNSDTLMKPLYPAIKFKDNVPYYWDMTSWNIFPADSVAVVNSIPEMQAFTKARRILFNKDSIRGGNFNLIYDPTITEDGGVYFDADGIGAGWVWQRVITPSEAYNIQWFGAVSGGSITAYLRTIISRGKNIFIPEGTWLVDSVVIDRSVTISGAGERTVIELTTPTVLNANAFRVTADNVTIKDLVVDGDSSSRTGIYIVGNNARVNVKMKDFTADASSSTSTSGLFVLGNNFVGSVVAKNFINTGQANGSNPRVVTVGGTANNYYFDFIQADTLRAGAVIGQTTGFGVIMNMALTYAEDNGIYHLGGGGLTVGTISYNGDEECIVTERSQLEVGTILGRGRWNRLLGIEDAVYVNIGKIIMYQDDGTGSGNAVTLRTGNVSSGKIFIGEISGTLRGDNLMAFGSSSGSLSYLTIGTVDVQYFYNPTYSGTLSNWADLTGCHGVSINSFKVKIIDETSALANSNRFLLTYPSDSLDQLSFINNLQIHITDNDEETVSDAVFRGVNFAQQLVKWQGLIWDNTDVPYAREVNMQEDARPNTTNFIPTQGYWPWGTTLEIRQRRKKSFQIRCISSGTPGGWINSAMSNVRRLTTTAITVDSLDEIILSLPNIGNTTATLPAPSNREAFYQTSGGAQWTRTYRIKNIAEPTNPYTLYIKTPSGKIFDNDNTGVDSLLLMPSKSVDLVSNGTNWYTLGGNKDTSFFIKLNDSVYSTKSGNDTIAMEQWVRTNFAGSGSGVTSVSGTTNRVTSTGGTTPVIDISSSYVGQSSITTLGTIATGTWNGTAIGDTYISSAATWNAKQTALSGTGLLSFSGTTPAYNTTSSAISGIISDETGSGAMVFANTPTLVTPILGVASATSHSITGTGGAGFLEVVNQSSAPSTPTSAGRIYFDASNRLSWKGTNGFTRTFDGTANTADRVYTLPDLAGTVALTANNLSAFAATTSSQLLGVISDETGSGALMFGTNPTATGLTLAGTLAISGSQDIGTAAAPVASTYSNIVRGGSGSNLIVQANSSSNAIQFRRSTTEDMRLSVTNGNLLIKTTTDNNANWILQVNGGVAFNGTNTAAATTGNQTINKTSGTVNFAAAATTLTVTNSLVSTSSIVFAVIRTNDATATIKNVVPGSGSFVITLAAAATAETSVGFFVINNF